MGLENTLRDLAERRLAFRAFRSSVDEELRKLRAEKLGVEQSAIEHIIVRAVAEGATVGQIKRAYGTKDHRTVASIIEARAAEVTAMRDSLAELRLQAEDWFEITPESIIVTIDGDVAHYSLSEVDGQYMFISDEPLWNEDFSVRNEAVALLDGKTEADSDEARHLAEAFRGRNA